MSELQRFEMRQRKKHDRASEAAMIGAGTWGGLAAREGLAHEFLDRMENEDVRATRAFDDFVAKLQPGDVLFHRRPIKDSAFAVQPLKNLPHYGKDLPMTEAELMMAGKGDPYYHASLYMGGGKIGDAYDIEHGVRKNTPIRADIPEDIKAYRPITTQAEKQAALNYVRQMHGADYKDLGPMLRHGAEHLFSPFEGPATSRKVCEGALCTELAANAYPSIFPKQYMSPAQMRHSKDLDLVARYNPMGKVTAREKLWSRAVYPLVKNLKWGVGAGALAYGGMSLADYFKQHHGREAP